MDLKSLKLIRILYVEDEKELRESVVENLKPFIKSIFVAKDAQEGLAIYKNLKNSIDIIVTDIKMPYMDGTEMIDEIRRFDKDVPVIYTTAFDDSSLLIRTIKQSISGYILKPIDIEELLNTIIKAYASVENKNLREYLKDTNKILQKKVDEKTKNLLNILYTDTLTELPNRNALLKDMNQMQNDFMIAIIDIDSFGNINDIYGVETGNFVLKFFSQFLQNIINTKEYKLYRLGSDEFAIANFIHKENIYYIDEIKNIINNLKNKKIFLPNFEVEIYIGITIGMAVGKKYILEKADMALKKASEKNQNFYILKDSDIVKNEYKNHIKWINIIKNSIAKKNIIPFLQPIVDKNENIQSYEALMRIEDEKNIYSPFDFLQIAQKAKMYFELSKIMIDKSMKMAVEHQKIFSINLSYLDMVNPEIFEYIRDKLSYYNAGNNIIFEILEHEEINDFEKIYKFISMAKNMGAKIAIDDFGSGYANFIYILKIKPDFVKIDGSIIKEIDKNYGALTIAKAIVEFSKKLNITTIAEFIHSKSVFEVAKSIGIDKFQGFYFSKPTKNLDKIILKCEN